jgi:alpha-beta hydrolase superfamily lysophospholipase
MKILQKDFAFRSPIDGCELEGTYIYPEKPIGIVQFLHGMAEHKTRYFGVMEALAKEGYTCLIHNHRGHGNCEITGHFGDGGANGMIEDAKLAGTLAKQEFPNLPLFLFGHSMGSLIARCCIRRFDEEYAGAFICGTPFAAPALIKVARALIAFKIKLHGDQRRSKTINAMVTGAFNKKVENPVSPNQWITFNEQNVAAYDADPLCGFCFTLNGFKGLMELMDETFTAKSWVRNNPNLPIHFISGAEDPCHGGLKNFQTAVSLMEAQGYPVTARIFEEMRHEILLEKENAIVYAHILEALKEMQK